MNAVCSTRPVMLQEHRMLTPAMELSELPDFFEPYTRTTFKNPPTEHWIDGWKIEYMGIFQPETAHRTPIVIIGGAFQNFNSYKYCVEQLLAAGPLILIDLPSMGSNQQITNITTGESAETLELPDLSAFLGRWVSEVGLHKVSVMGMSLGSVVASHFADQFPDRVDRMILMGVMQKTRKSWRMLLEESLHLLQEGRMDEFGQAVVLYLINHAKLDETRLSPTAKRLFYKQMSEFAHTEKVRYDINCNRLLRLTHVPVPQCDTLVAAGEFDSFTLPFENAHFALQCPRMQFAFIKGADHVPQLERRKETMALFAAYLQDQDIAQVEGIRPVSREELEKLERRGEPRVHLREDIRKINHRHKMELVQQVRVVDLNFFGVLLECDSPEAAAQLMAEPRNMALQLGNKIPKADQAQTSEPTETTSEPAESHEPLALECLIFEQQGNRVRALFKHGNFDNAEALKALLASDQIVENSLHA